MKCFDSKCVLSIKKDNYSDVYGELIKNLEFYLKSKKSILPTLD